MLTGIIIGVAAVIYFEIRHAYFARKMVIGNNEGGEIRGAGRGSRPGGADCG